MNERQWAFFRDFLGGFWEVQFVQNEITSWAQDRFRLWLEEPEAKQCAERLFARRVVDVPKHKLRLRLKSLREADGGSFNHIEVTLLGKKKRRRRQCFVGHRFLPGVERTLRWNLRQVLEPYNVELDWSGGDIRSVQILDDIVRRIRAADFCIFDTRATEGKPNVYIEAGICYAIRKPFILFGHRLSAGAVPSDLEFALALEYDSYRQLFRNFYYRLPLFFRKNIR
jgi:hypothetical protein